MTSTSLASEELVWVKDGLHQFRRPNSDMQKNARKKQALFLAYLIT